MRRVPLLAGARGRAPTRSISIKILIDQQEKQPIAFLPIGNVSAVVTKHLPFGDYWCEMESGVEMPIMFERKSAADLYATLSNSDQIDRHKEKLRKAREVDAKLYLIIEGSLSEILSGVGYSKVEPGPLVKRIFTFMVKYDFHPIFCNNRDEMKRFMLETWEAFGRNYK